MSGIKGDTYSPFSKKASAAFCSVKNVEAALLYRTQNK
jgi:hypothetical protein